MPFIQNPPMVASYKTVVQNRIQAIDIDTVKMHKDSINASFPHVVLL